MTCCHGLMAFGFRIAISRLLSNARMQSGIILSSAQSPPPITFPALAVAKTFPCFSNVSLLKNESLKFVCKDVYLNVETENTIFTKYLEDKKVLRVPVAHGDGNYFADEATLNSLVENDQIVFKYCSEDGKVEKETNPNGSLLDIAGIVNKNRNVLGMMPHPERCCSEILGNTDGALIFTSVANNLFK